MAAKVQMMDVVNMTEKEFEIAREKLMTMSGSSIELARKIWVEGMERSAAASDLGMSRQSAYQAMKKATILVASIPKGWVHLNEWMPKELADEVRRKVKAEKKRFENPEM